tara:strand:+ start:91 stop:696 length:606 start_codon:yes stop_codon:yes gene_type:complete
MSQLNVGSITGNPTVTGNITVNGQVKASSFRHPTASADAISINSSNEVTAINGFASGILSLDQWYLNTNKTDSSDISTWTRYLNYGSGMSLSGAVFTFPTTGFWLVYASILFRPVTNDNNYFYTYFSTDGGSNWSYRSRAQANSHLDNRAQNGATMAFLDITNTTTHKVKFTSGSIGGNSYIQGNGNLNESNVVFARIADT